jgi:hypothetical protein
MASARMLHSGPAPVTGEQIPECRDPPPEDQSRPVAKTQEGDDRQLLELFELQERMFRGS